MAKQNAAKNDYTAIQMENRANGKAKFSKMLSGPRDKGARQGCVIYENEFLRAVARNDIEKCKALLLKGNALDQETYFHPLLLAAKKGHHEIMDLLLKESVDINVRDQNDSTALHFAIQRKSIACCNLLLDSGININTQDKDGNLPLHIAAKIGILEIVDKLLQKNNVPNATNKKSQTPLHLACKEGKDEILKLLLDNGGRWDLQSVDSWLPIHFAAFHGHHRCCEMLVTRSEDHLKQQLDSRNKDKATALILAAKKGHSRCCQILKDSDINAFDAKANTALHLAATVGFIKTVEVLLEMEPNIYAQNKSGNTSFHKAAILKNSDCLKLLVEKYPGINPGLNFEDQNLLHIAALNNSYKNLEFLLEFPIFIQQINDKDKLGRTPLCMALSQNSLDCPELLITKGADCFITDNEQNLPLHIAARNGNFQFCKTLLAGSRVQTINSRNINGATALHLAATKGSMECCKFLLTKGADLSAIDSDGYSAFHAASLAGRLEVIKFFTKKGGGFINQVVEVSGDTSLHLAVRSGSYECCSFILKNMKKDKVLKCNNNKKGPLDEAFEDEHDNIFDLILSKVPLPTAKNKPAEQYYEFEHTLHEYMHEALLSGREIIQEAIVNSEWWYSGFSSCFCNLNPCPNLNYLTEENPGLAEAVYNKCIETNKDSIVYNFQIFESSYTVPREDTDSEYLKRRSPYEATGKLRSDAKLQTPEKEHPLMIAVQNEYLNLMEHPLTTAYLNYKWHSYMKFILFIMALCEISFVIVVGLYLNYVQNYDMKENGTQIYNRTYLCSENTAPSSDIPKTIIENWTAVLGLYIILSIMTIFIIFLEIQCHRKKKSLRFIMCAVRFYRVFGTIILLAPVSGCSYDIIIKETWQWQIGIITLLLSWFHTIHTLNELPFLSVFMPVTKKFCLSFLRVLFYILLIVFIFCFTFHLLLRGDNNSAFENIPISFVKTIVWMLGDLAYDDTFLNSSGINYPIMTNFIFLLLVTCISGFIINLVIAQPADYAEKFREMAAYHKLASKINLFIKIDIVFEYVRRQSLQRKGCIYEKKKKQVMKPHESQTASPVESSDVTENGGKDDLILKIILEKVERLEAQLTEQKK